MWANSAMDRLCCARVAVVVGTLSSVTAVAAGRDWTMALKADGTVWTWGSNVDGALGVPFISSSNVPVRVHPLASHRSDFARTEACARARRARPRLGVGTEREPPVGQLNYLPGRTHVVPAARRRIFSTAMAIAAGGAHSVVGES